MKWYREQCVKIMWKLFIDANSQFFQSSLLELVKGDGVSVNEDMDEVDDAKAVKKRAREAKQKRRLWSQSPEEEGEEKEEDEARQGTGQFQFNRLTVSIKSVFVSASTSSPF